jgi:hypothetical protein
VAGSRLTKKHEEGYATPVSEKLERFLEMIGDSEIGDEMNRIIDALYSYEEDGR